MAANIFNFESPDLILLQRWMRKQPKQFSKAARNMLNAVAGSARNHAIENIEKGTTTRSRSFVRNSLRAQNVKPGTPLNQMVSETYSFDISRQGRSSGFEELENGTKSRSDRVPTMQSRGGGQGKQSSKVAGQVRMNKTGGMIKPKQFRGPRAKKKQQMMSAMMRHIREKNIKKPFIVPSGLTGTLGRMKPAGVWRRKSKGNISAMNPFKGERSSTKRIRWMQRAVLTVTSRKSLQFLWDKEIDSILRKK